jgi:hypothetical protein
VAILQISRITNRKGLTENLPQLAGAELGWCIDSRRLFVGNGTLQEGAPIIGNTEILTEYSDITVLSNYTYEDIAVGYAAQTGPSPSEPVVRTVQAKLDDIASVRDFGAVGDGVADDTVAINRALYQLYCRETNTQVRRMLYFPAGTYRVTETIVIPTYAKLVGEGANCSVIFLDTSADISSLNAYVARYGDSLQQTGVNIGANGAVTPRDIEISSMGFQTSEITDIFLVEAADQCWFDSVDFIGPVTENDLIDTGFDPASTNIACVRFSSTPASPCRDITFDKCGFINNTYAINTNQDIRGITVSNAKFNTLYQGVVINGDVTGFRSVHNTFDIIYAEGIVYDCELNVSAYNIFYNVGNDIGGINPSTPVVRFGNDNNVSIGDLFQRTDLQDQQEPRVSIINSTATTGGTLIQLGRYTRENGRTFTLANNVGSATTILSVNSQDVKAFSMEYTIVRGVLVRRGNITVVTGPSDDSSSVLAYTDDYTDNFDTGITLTANEASNTITIRYTSTNLGFGGTLTYSISHLA